MKKLILPLLLATTFVGFAQKASQKLTFQKGQTIEVINNVNMTTESMMGEMPGSVLMTETYTVNDVTANNVVLVKTPKKIKLNFSMMGRDMSIDSDKPEDLNGQFGQPIKELLNQKQEFTIDATGKIVAVKQDEKQKKENTSEGMMGMMMPGLNANGGLLKVGSASMFKILPDKEVAKGDNWVDSLNADGNNSKTIYTVKDITDKEILLDYTSEGKTKGTQAAMGMNIDMTANIKSNGTVTIDKATGLLKQRTMTSTTETNMNMGGQEMASTTKMTMVTTVKSL